MYRNIAISTGFHLFIIIVATLSLPFLTKTPIELPPIVSIELIQITDKTSIPFAPKAKKIIEKIKKEEKERVVSEQAPPKKIKKVKLKKSTEKGIISRTVRLEEDLRNKFSFKFSFNLLAIDKLIQKFFQSIEFRLIRFKEIRAEEKRQIKLEKIEQAEKEKIEIEKQKKADELAFLKEKEIQLKQEQKLERERAKDKRKGRNKREYK